MKLIRSKNKNKLPNEIKKKMGTIPRRNDSPDYKQTQSPAVDLDSNNWKMLIVDDEPDVHEITRIGLKGFTFDGKKLELISAHSAEQAREILQNDRHFAVALIDVVMETEEAGLDLVRFIREEMRLSHIRIIIRTGQPGKAPERFVIDNFDIDDYKEKTDLTTLKMYTMSRSSIKSYRDILTIERSRIELEQKVKERTKELHEANKELVEKQKDIASANQKLENLNAELKHDQSLAETVFNNILSEIPSNYTNISFSLIPMSTVGGDMFLSTQVFTDRQYVFLGDFTGHGLSAAIGAIPVAEIFSQIQDSSHSIEDIARKMNKKLKALLPTGLFLCACLIEVDYSADKIYVWIGGLPDALIFDRNNQLKKRVLSKHLPMGILGDKKFDDKLEIISVDEGDQIFFFSDGITEAVNKAGEMFGQERLENFITNCQNPENSIDEIVKNLNSFCKDAERSDDITIATIRYQKISDKE